MSLLSRLLRRIGGSSSTARRLMVVACGLAPAVMWLVPSTASAAQIHVFSSTFGSSGSGAGQVSSPQDVAVNDTTGDVYVADTGNDRVDEFSASGTFIEAWGWGVADGAASFETCTTTCQAGVSGSGPGQFESPTFIAVDNSSGPSAGDVYVGDTGDNLVTKFDASGNLVSSWGDATPADGQLSGGSASGGPFTSMAGIAVDGSGNLNVYDPNSLDWFVFAQGGSAQPTISVGRGTDDTGIGVDSSGDLYKVVGLGSLEQFSSAGTDLGDVSDDQTGGQITGFAIDPTTNDIYADDGGSEIRHYAGSSLSACAPAGNCAATETFGSAHLSGTAAGVAINATSGAVYVADTGADQVAVFAAETVPDVTTGSVSNTASRSATLNGTVNPDGTTLTDCRFDYGTDTSYGQTAPCKTIPSGSAAVAVTADVGGLEPATTYHYRLQAGNANGTSNGQDALMRTAGPTPPDTCPNAAFRQGPSANLPDCRAYEMVTPPYKDGFAVTFGPPAGAVFADGSLVLGNSFGTFAGSPNNTFLGATYEFARTASGWTTIPISPSGSQLPTAHFEDAAPDGSTTLWTTTAGQDDLFIRHADGAITTIGPTQPPSQPASEAGGDVFYMGASSDFSHVLFRLSNTSSGALWPFDTTTGSNASSLYEYVGTGLSQPALVGVSGGPGSTSLISQCGTSLGGPLFNGDTYNAVSASGATVFFTPLGADDTSCGGTQPPVDELFARIDQSQTVAISEPSSADCAACDTTAPQDATFQGASQDGSKVFFLTSQPLLGGDSTENLYEYDFNAPAGQKVTRVSAGDPSGANVEGVVRVSEDGSLVYFVAQGVLTSNPNSQGQVAQEGANNLYVYEPDPANPGRFKTVFIAALSSNDAADWAVLDVRPAQATPDGRYLLFSSVANLTGDAPDHTEQIFRYDAQTGALVRVSLGQAGFNDNGTTSNASEDAPAFAGNDQLSGTNLDISDDGSYVFFTSSAGLTPQALNDVSIDQNGDQANNVYEYHDGNVYLLSDGRDTDSNGGPSAVQFVGTDASGADAFFTTADPLVPADTDTQVDLYDARIDGGFPAPSQPAGCQGDGCQGTPSEPPAVPTAATVTFSGPGNVPPGAAASTRVKALSRVVHGSTFFVRVNAPGRGRITITGAGITTVHMSVSKAGTFAHTVALTAKDRRALATKRKLKLKLRVSFTPASGTASTANISLTVEPALRHRTNHARRASSPNRGGAR